MAAVETPAAPGAESLLLAPGRLEDAAWASARAACEEDENALGAELEARGLLTSQEFEVACTAAVFDGAFALSLNVPSGWEVSEAVRTAVAGPAVEPRRLVTETSRRLAVLGGQWGAPAEFARTRISPAVPVASGISSRYSALLQASNGRRTPRDLAFSLGRGLYPVMVDLARMRALGLVQPEPAAAGHRPSTAPRRLERQAPDATPATATPLPRRSPGTHRTPRTDTA